jgi:hypothetical protein
MTDDRTPQDNHLLFRPDTFFLKPWRGWGVVRDRRGRVIDRYTGEGQGRTGTRSATSQMTFTFASGLVQTSEIDILSDDDGHYFARDPRSGIEGRGRFIGDEFRWTFDAMPIPNLSGPLGRRLRARMTATYTLTSPSTAVGLTQVRLFGLVVRTMTAFFQHV